MDKEVVTTSSRLFQQGNQTLNGAVGKEGNMLKARQSVSLHITTDIFQNPNFARHSTSNPTSLHTVPFNQKLL